MAQSIDELAQDPAIAQQILFQQMILAEEARARRLNSLQTPGNPVNGAGTLASLEGGGGDSDIGSYLNAMSAPLRTALSGAGPQANLVQLMLRSGAYMPGHETDPIQVGRTADEGRQMFRRLLNKSEQADNRKATSEELAIALQRNQLSEAYRQQQAQGASSGIRSAWGGGGGGGQRVGDMMLGRGVGDNIQLQQLMQRKLKSDLGRSLWENERSKYLDLEAEKTNKIKDSRRALAFDLMLKAMRKGLHSRY